MAFSMRPVSPSFLWSSTNCRNSGDGFRLSRVLDNPLTGSSTDCAPALPSRGFLGTFYFKLLFVMQPQYRAPQEHRTRRQLLVAAGIAIFFRLLAPGEEPLLS